MKTALVSGSFDPVTVGHADIVARAVRLFGRVVVAVTDNSEKRYMFPLAVRAEAARACFGARPEISVEVCTGLIADFAAERDAVLVRGARSGSDFDYERMLCGINRSLSGVDSIVLPAAGELDHISSSFVRELIKYGRPLTGAVPAAAIRVLEAYRNRA